MEGTNTESQFNEDQKSVFSLRPDYPDFLNLPWHLPLNEWTEKCPLVVQLPRGLSRHSVVFVNYQSRIYALKELPPDTAKKEYEILRQMEELALPTVEPVGHVLTSTSEGDASVLITKYLDHSLPYHQVFMRSSLQRYREHLLDAMSSLLVQLHLAGVYWGDCSLSNTLFRRDAGKLQAYFVDAETSEIHPSLSDTLREHELEIMEENIVGGIGDLAAMGVISNDIQLSETEKYLREKYESLWNEINREVIIAPDEKWRIQERVRNLNSFGFSVDEVEVSSAEGGNRLRMRVFVTDRNFHSDLLHSLTGLEAQEEQARRIINEIQELRMTISESGGKDTPLSVAAYYWMNEIYFPTLEEMKSVIDSSTEPIELYCNLLEEKWYLSEHAGKDVGHSSAIESLKKKLFNRGS